MYNPKSTPPVAVILPVELTASLEPECTAAIARIESVRIKSREAFLKSIQQNLWTEKDLPLFVNYVMTVCFAVNHELCTLGRRRKWRPVWRVTHIRQRSEQFREAFIVFKAYPEDGRDRYGRPLERVSDDRGRLLPGFQKMLEQHELWDAGQTELSAVAKHQAGRRPVDLLPSQKQPGRPFQARKKQGAATQPPAHSTPPPVLRPGHAAEIEQYKAKKGFATDAQAAWALGVSEDVLKSIKSRRGRLRCSQETEKAVLDKIAKILKTP
jgi:hypothetical protein